MCPPPSLQPLHTHTLRLAFCFSLALLTPDTKGNFVAAEKANLLLSGSRCDSKGNMIIFPQTPFQPPPPLPAPLPLPNPPFMAASDGVGVRAASSRCVSEWRNQPKGASGIVGIHGNRRGDGRWPLHFLSGRLRDAQRRSGFPRRCGPDEASAENLRSFVASGA